MRSNKFFIVYACLALVQILLCNYLNISYLLTLSILPVMVLLIPVKHSTISAMVIAFFTGLMVDLLADGVLGMNILALLPVALARKGLLRLIFGQEVFAHKEDVTLKKYGILKFTAYIAIAQGLFLLIYIAADGAGTRPFWFNLSRFGISLLVGTIVSLLIAEAITKNYRER